MSWLEDPIPTEQLVLHMQKVGFRQAVPQFVAQTLDFQTHTLPDMFEQMVMDLSAYVLTDKVESRKREVTIEFPATAWQLFKRDYIPKRFRRRWPVRNITMRKVVTFEREIAYPDADYRVPQERFGKPVIWEKITEAAWERIRNANQV